MEAFTELLNKNTTNLHEKRPIKTKKKVTIFVVCVGAELRKAEECKSEEAWQEEEGEESSSELDDEEEEEEEHRQNSEAEEEDEEEEEEGEHTQDSAHDHMAVFTPMLSAWVFEHRHT